MSNHRSAVIPIIVTPAPAPGVIGSSQNNTNMIPATPTKGVPHSYAQDHWVRYSHLKGMEGAKDELIEDVLTRYDSVVRQLKGLIDERNASNSKESATMRQQAEYIDYLQKLMNGNPFIVAVVDGNNFLFNEAFIREGETGGRRAAVAFKNELTEWVPKNVEDAPSDFKILVKVYADFKDLAVTLMRAGIIGTLSTFHEFARGFNTLFDFVDIGGGDANSKILDHLKLFLYDYHCRQVIFGGAPQLLNANAQHEDMFTKRVALLQSVSTNVNMPFKTVSFPEVFRTSKIMTSVPIMTPRTGTPASTVENGNGQPPVSHSRHGSLASTVENRNSQPQVARSRNDSLASSVTSATAPAPKTWAKLAQDVATLPQTDAVPRAVQQPNRRHNKKGQRIDAPFNLDWEALKRVKQIKMCNMHYLHSDGCKWSEGRCNHRHNYDATDDEIEILRSVSRETACKNGVTCDEIVCVYGHRCPYPALSEGSMRGLGCVMGEKCRFPREMHGIKDSTPARATNTGKF